MTERWKVTSLDVWGSLDPGFGGLVTDRFTLSLSLAFLSLVYSVAFATVGGLS